MLERVFPQDYAPRAAERARFHEFFDAECAREAEGGEIALPGRGEPLQNVQDSVLAGAVCPPPLNLKPTGRVEQGTCF